MNLEFVIQNEVSQREKNKYINMYIWSLEKWYWWVYLQGRNREADIDNRLVGTVEEGESDLNWESSTDIYMLPCVKGIASRKKEKAMAPHSSTLAWKIPWTEEPGGLQSMGSHRVGHDWTTSLSLFTFMPWRREWQPSPVFLPGES